MPLPKYFVSYAGNDESTNPSNDHTFLPTHVVDSFFLGNRPTSNREWIVMTDIAGALRALPADLSNTFPPSVQAEMAYHEVSGAVFGRMLEVEEFFLLDVQVLEQPADTPGPNDPVYLYGILYGPYSNIEDAPISATKGQLTITRADALAGLVQGAAHAFRYVNSADPGEPPSCCFHMMLPGDREEEIRHGQGIVLAYPLLPAELALSAASNETVVNQLLYDLLSALKEDLSREGIENLLCSMTLPVPSRSNLEYQLEFEGYTIKGDTAIREVSAGKGFGGLLASVFGTLTQERLDLPPQGNVDDFLKIARDALKALPGWPSPRAIALRERVKAVSTERRGAIESISLLPSREAGTPRPSSTPMRVRLPAMSEAGETPAWMQDFIEAHRKPGAPPPKLTSIVGPRQHKEPHPKPSSAKKPDWMKDFEPDSPITRTGKSNQSNPPDKPDWMKDFE
ncbi:MAG: hypothetical protein KJ077_02395 [Anaerolineae bacterium]|nr:hypothetical protein [Anaerolineae bacterium]